MIENTLEYLVDDNLSAFQSYLDTNDIDINIQLNLRIDDIKDFPIENPTPILLACYFESEACFEYLIDMGADPFITDSYNRNCFHYIAFRGQIEFLRRVVSLIIGDINKYCFADRNGLTPVHIATIANNDEIIKFLYEKNVPIEAIEDNQGRSPIRIAIQYGNIESFDLIKDNSAEVNSRNMQTLLQSAIKFDRVEILKKLLSENPKISGMALLRYASQNGSLFSAKYIIQNHINQFENELNKAFIDACANGHTCIVKLLNKNGCDPNMRVEGMLSPLMASVKNGHFETCEFLFELGACIKKISGTKFEIPSSDRPLKEFYDSLYDISNFNDETSELLLKACEKGNGDILRLLLRHINTDDLIKNDENLRIDKIKLIKATCKAIKNHDRSKKSSSGSVGKKQDDDDDIVNEEEEEEDEDDDDEDDNEIKESLGIVSRKKMTLDYPFYYPKLYRKYDPNYGIIYAMFNTVIKKAIKGSIDPLDALTTLEVLIDDEHLLPRDITSQLIKCIRSNLLGLIRFMLDHNNNDHGLLPFDPNNNDLRKLVENLSNEKEIQDKFVKKGVKLTGEPCIFTPPFDEKTEFDSDFNQ